MIRRATKNDLDAINRLGEQLHTGFKKLFHIETEIDSMLAIVLVSEDKSGVNGYLYALDFGDNIDLLSIFVDNKYRNKHIATSMLQFLVEESINQTITLEVSSNNIPALNLYHNFGFKNVGVRKNYYEDSDAYIMKWGKNK